MPIFLFQKRKMACHEAALLDKTQTTKLKKRTVSMALIFSVALA